MLGMSGFSTPQQAPVVFAHQGGWDEILMVVGPIGIVWWLLRLAKRRIDRQQPEA